MDLATNTFIWDMKREAFTIPFLNIPIYWYGILFALGFFFGYLVIMYCYKRHLASKRAFFLHELNFKEFTKEWENIQNNRLLKGCFDTLSTDDREKIKKGEWTCPLKNKVLSLLSHININVEKETLSKKDQKMIRFTHKKRVGSLWLTARFHIEQKFPHVFKPLEKRAKEFIEKLTFFVIVGTVVGARLGHLLFYEDISAYLSHPLSIINTREGGLASHGGALGIFIALALFCRHYRKLGEKVSWRFILDLIIIPTAIAAVFIRLGNFVNQEIIGTPSNLPWAIIFPYNFEHLSAVPRHPAQLYEAIAYLITFIALFGHWHYRFLKLRAGELSGIFLIMVFGARFIIEFFKESQLLTSNTAIEHYLSMGQWLSIPMVILGGSVALFLQEKQESS